MVDFEIQRSSRKCAATEREFKAGEFFFSVLMAEQADVIRRDYCAEAWEGPPEESLGWWRSQMPNEVSKKANWAPNDVMMHYFESLKDQVEKQDLRYILTLLMIRRRILKLEDSELDEEGRDQLVVFCPRNESEYKVLVVDPDAARIKAIQDELGQLLFRDAA
ncbi:MAG: hypothetical protein ACI9G1_000953 [Pirellulaceae bacterium]|jgi:hypothetical protein